MLLKITFSLVMCLGALLAAQAQNVGDVPTGEIGDPQSGFEYAYSTCGDAMPVGDEQSPNPNAPRFKDVVNTPGMTPTALMVWLQGAHYIRRCRIL